MTRIESVALRHGFHAALALAAAGGFLLGLLLLWRGDGPALPRPAPRPGTPRGAAPAPRRRTTDARLHRYLQLLLADAHRYDVPFEGGKLLSPFPVWITEGPWRMTVPGARLTTAQLRIRALRRTLPTPLGGGLGSYRSPTVILSVENRTDDYLAFRVDTQPSGKAACQPKAALPQPTLVLGPREALERTECLSVPTGRDVLTVRRIVAIRIPALSYHYLLGLRPVAVGLPARIAEGHTLPEGHRRCGGIPRQEIEQALRSGEARWIDVIDFYARFSCERRDFPVGYRRPGEPPQPSPVVRSALLRR